MVPLITSIREQAEAIRREEVAKTLGKIKGQMSADSEELAGYLDAMTAALIKKLLHQPTVFFKENRGPAQQELARQLFDLDGTLDGGKRRRGRK